MASEWANGGPSAESQDPGGSDAELRELEDELCRLGGVLAVRVVGDRNGRPIEVHVLADQSKPAKQTVRDVRAVAQTMFGLELDHRIVSVAQLDSAAEHIVDSGSADPGAPCPRRPGQLRGPGRARRRPGGARRRRPRVLRLRRGLGRRGRPTTTGRTRDTRRGAPVGLRRRGDPRRERRHHPGRARLASRS